MSELHSDEMNPMASPNDDEPLFPGFEPPEVLPIDASLSPGRRLTLCQANEIANGIHPISKGPLHAQADPHRTNQDGRRDPFTCGSCVFRDLFGWHNATWPKCTSPHTPLASRGPATDVRAWWPACAHYEAKET